MSQSIQKKICSFILAFFRAFYFASETKWTQMCSSFHDFEDFSRTCFYTWQNFFSCFFIISEDKCFDVWLRSHYHQAKVCCASIFFFSQFTWWPNLNLITYVSMISDHFMVSVIRSQKRNENLSFRMNNLNLHATASGTRAKTEHVNKFPFLFDAYVTHATASFVSFYFRIYWRLTIALPKPFKPQKSKENSINDRHSLDTFP